MRRTVTLQAIGLAILTLATAQGQAPGDKSGNGTRKTNISFTVDFPGIVVTAYWVDTAGKEQEKQQIGAPIGANTKALSFVALIPTTDTHLWRFKIDGKTVLTIRAEADWNQTAGIYLTEDGQSWRAQTRDLKDGKVGRTSGTPATKLSAAQLAELTRRKKGN